MSIVPEGNEHDARQWLTVYCFITGRVVRDGGSEEGDLGDLLRVRSGHSVTEQSAFVDRTNEQAHGQTNDGGPHRNDLGCAQDAPRIPWTDREWGRRVRAATQCAEPRRATPANGPDGQEASSQVMKMAGRPLRKLIHPMATVDGRFSAG